MRQLKALNERSNPMPERQPPSHEDTTETQQQVLRTFAEQYLLPKVTALEAGRGISADFLDQLYSVLPDVFPSLVETLSRQDDPELRFVAAHQLERTYEAGPKFVTDVLGRLLNDPDPELAGYAADVVQNCIVKGIDPAPPDIREAVARLTRPFGV